jgi:hypothetical protein
VDSLNLLNATKLGTYQETAYSASEQNVLWKITELGADGDADGDADAEYVDLVESMSQNFNYTEPCSEHNFPVRLV